MVYLQLMPGATMPPSPGNLPEDTYVKKFGLDPIVRGCRRIRENVPRPIEKKEVDGGMTRTWWLTEVTFFSSSVALN